MRSNTTHLGGIAHPLMTAERLDKLADPGSNRLNDMDASGIDLQVISNITSVASSRTGKESVKLAREANDQLASAVVAHLDRFARFASLPMSQSEG